MIIRPCYGSDIEEMIAIDTDPQSWDGDAIHEYVCDMGLIKVACEGDWILGWMAYRSNQALLAVERFVVREDPQTEVATALRLVKHLERFRYKCNAVDIPLPEKRMAIAKTLSHNGWQVGIIRDYWPNHSAITLHRQYAPAVGLATVGPKS